MKTVSILLSLVFVATTASAQAQSPGSEVQDKDLGRRKASRNSGLPVVGEFQRQPESEANEGRRQTREKWYAKNVPTRLNAPYGDPGALANGTTTESTNITIIDYVTIPTPGAPQDPPGIPASTTYAVMGTVLSGNSFIDKTNTVVYSDYKIRIDDILKGPATLAVGDEVIASRPGGAIHFPSGHTTNFLIINHGLPEVGSQYILFLWKPVPSLPEYEIALDSGYQLKNGRVYSLDEVNEQFYDGMSAPVFLGIVKKAIVASQNGAKP
jgi:hypothetical protein